jgi:hypothetical protein
MLASVWQWSIAHGVALRWLAVLSAVTFVGTLIAIPILVARIPADYFVDPKRHRHPWTRYHPVIRGVLLAVKNLIGGAFVLLGLALLVLPGQGILTIVIGLTLVNFPGKYRLERWLVARAPVLRAINALRARLGAIPLQKHGSDPE